MDDNSMTTENNIPVTKKSKTIVERFQSAPKLVKYGLVILPILLLLIGGYYWYSTSQRIYTDKAEIVAPLIVLSPNVPNVLQKVLVKNGEHVLVEQPVARLANGDFVRAKTDGVVVGINNKVGELFTPGMPIVTMIDPNELRLVVHVAEDKGFSSIQVGQKVVFEVDAFDSQTFDGVIEEIAQSSDQSSVVFSISDKRVEKEYSIKIKYNNYPQLLNGMSAKVWIYR